MDGSQGVRRVTADFLLELLSEEIPARMQARARNDLGRMFAEELDEAGWSLCVLGQDDPQCSTAGGYRGNERGESPRPACRGTRVGSHCARLGGRAGGLGAGLRRGLVS